MHNNEKIKCCENRCPACQGAPQDLHRQAGNFLVGQAVVHAVSERKDCNQQDLFPVKLLAGAKDKVARQVADQYVTLIRIEQIG